MRPATQAAAEQNAKNQEIENRAKNSRKFLRARPFEHVTRSRVALRSPASPGRGAGSRPEGTFTPQPPGGQGPGPPVGVSGVG